MQKIEQILKGEVVKDYDENLSPKDIFYFVSKYLNLKTRRNPYQVIIDDQEINLFIKNISYLGKPHLSFKKRIQIPQKWRKPLLKRTSLLLGLYKYKDTLIFACFDKQTYLGRNINNSSAHISTNDLLQALQDENGIFEKRDSGGNTISVIQPQHLKNFLRLKIRNISVTSPEIALFQDFEQNIPIHWRGIDCYKTMIKDGYSNALQSEWAGFYFEFLFQNFLEQDPKNKEICLFLTNKRKDEVDLDLYFQKTKHYGDLKTHSKSSSAILGNDKEATISALKEMKRLWYVVLEVSSRKDKYFEYVTTKFWNKTLNKKNLYSYGNRMKYDCDIKSIKILEINKSNQKYLSDFKQGLNSDGKPRAVKFSISKRSMSNFLLYHSDLKNQPL